MPGHYVHEDWTPSFAIFPLSITIPGIIYSMLILAYPPPTPLTRKLSILFLSIPMLVVFWHSDYMFPTYDLVDTFGRACLIWFAHMSYEVCVLEFEPVIKHPGQRGEMKERLRQAYKVFFDRSRSQVLEQQEQCKRPVSPTALSNSKSVEAEKEDSAQDTYTATDKKTDEPIVLSVQKVVRETGTSHYQHGLSRWHFVRYHILKALSMYALQYLWQLYQDHYSPLRKDPAAFITQDTIHFFSRLPQSLHYKEVYFRTEEAFDWNIVTMWFYEGYHSIIAALHVGLKIDEPEEWSLNLFGPITEAWSVRRYWSKFWHNYIYYSFSGHIKCATRGWLRMRRGSVVTRLLENTLVFLASGLMHSLVRLQQSPQDDIWAITVFYVAQMVPLIIESVVVYYWREAKKMLGLTEEKKWVGYVEYAVGYTWTFAWQFYSVPTYYLLRHHWTNIMILKQWRAEFERLGLNETGGDENLVVD